MFTLQDIQRQLASFSGGGGNSQTGAQFGGNISPTGMTYPTPENTGPVANYNPGAGAGADSGFGMNLGTAGAALGGLNALSGFLQGNKTLKLAKDQFKFQKELGNTNLNNSIKSYNTALEDRLTSRGAMQGDSAETTQERIGRNRLSR